MSSCDDRCRIRLKLGRASGGVPAIRCRWLFAFAGEGIILRVFSLTGTALECVRDRWKNVWPRHAGYPERLRSDSCEDRRRRQGSYYLRRCDAVKDVHPVDAGAGEHTRQATVAGHRFERAGTSRAAQAHIRLPFNHRGRICGKWVCEPWSF